MGTATTWRRTHTCGELRQAQAEQRVTLLGWVHNRRNFGGVLFVVIRDRYGITQLVFNPSGDTQLSEMAESLRHEFVIGVRGVVKMRPESQYNPDMATGEIEVVVDELVIINKSETPPIQIHNPDWNESEETRLRYRYLDLRTPSMQSNLLFRHQLVAEMRKYLWEQQFIELETPILMKSTPEGARDFLVPSRLNPGRFYALPQSPQTFKQLLMVSGFDRYFQVARCFRDEDLRADRQPEFTQVDAEMSFVSEEDIFAVFEGMIAHAFRACLGVEVALPLQRMSYHEAFHTYGSDKPDLRFGLPIGEVTSEVSDSGFKVFRSVVAEGGRVAAIAAPGGAASVTRKHIDALTAHVAKYGAKGLVWLRITDSGVESPTAKFLSEQELAAIRQRAGANAGDMVFVIAAPEKVCFTALGQLRLELGRLLGFIKEDEYRLCWVYEFPMFEYSEEEGRYMAMHHPFTAPVDEDVGLLDTDEFHKVRARAYDMVLNGSEIGGGSIRIHTQELQRTVFRRLGIGDEEAEVKFGFLLKAFTYGAPPHGGIAFGLDRLAMVMKGLGSIRDMIAFPKTTTGLSLMDGAPDAVDEVQLRELGIQIASRGKS